MLLGALLVFAPVIGIDYLLDNYVRQRETTHLQRRADDISQGMKASTYDAILSLRQILADSPSLCTPTFVSNIQKQMGASLNLRDVLVENPDGVQYCGAFGSKVIYSPLSEPLSIPGISETMQIVKLGDLGVPAIRVTQNFGPSRTVSAFVAVVPVRSEGLRNGLHAMSMVRISLTNGFTVLSAGDVSQFDRRKKDADLISAQSFSGEIPLRVEAAVPFATARADYADLDVSFTILSCLMCAAFLILMLQYVRRSQLPAFALERAIARNELKPYYQPVINLRTGKLAGCEVLCRWVKPNGEVVAPGAFIDYAEVTGLAIPMTLSLMQQVRADLSDLCVEMPKMKISINLFEGHFRDSNIVDDVQAIFGGTPINYRQLVFEITERRPLGNSTQANSVIAGFHALGARLAMDDVGTGHSNLAYMQTLGVDVIKIDRVFVDMIKADTTQVPVLDGLIAMARDLGTEVIAEGVETEAQALYLRARGVYLAQGFLFAPALKVEAFKELARALNPGKDAEPLASEGALSKVA
jgi:EAL domain-containing protein (putative c-di-GMP-specific phosphodiesterase class I)